jgi:hypothetical protein
MKTLGVTSTSQITPETIRAALDKSKFENE